MTFQRKHAMENCGVPSHQWRDSQWRIRVVLGSDGIQGILSHNRALGLLLIRVSVLPWTSFKNFMWAVPSLHVEEAFLPWHVRDTVRNLKGQAFLSFPQFITLTSYLLSYHTFHYFSFFIRVRIKTLRIDMLGGLCFLGMLPCHIKLIGNKFVCISFVIGVPGKNLEKVKGKRSREEVFFFPCRRHLIKHGKERLWLIERGLSHSAFTASAERVWAGRRTPKGKCCLSRNTPTVAFVHRSCQGLRASRPHHMQFSCRPFLLSFEIIIFCIFILPDSSQSAFIYIILLNWNIRKAQGPNRLSNLPQITQDGVGGHIIQFSYFSH